MGLCDHVIWKYKEAPEETKRANHSVARFLKVQLREATALSRSPWLWLQGMLDAISLLSVYDEVLHGEVNTSTSAFRLLTSVFIFIPTQRSLKKNKG